MIRRTIGLVAASGVVDRIVVSTDDAEIASIARDAGADVPFIRPAELSDDHTPTAPVVAHALGELPDGQASNDDVVLVVYPTAVLLDPDDLVAASTAFAAAGSRVAMTACAHAAPIERAWRRRADGSGEMLHPEHALTRTQDLEETYYDAGQFYLGTREFWSSDGDIASSEPLLWVLPRWRAIDIDTLEDLRLVERLVAVDGS